ncbi:hypothetical protein LAZ67_18001844 [Cordylochernes scorpioides]|uniref:Helix-turn-helix domain-containing protein n=1 Tax=Cordylochernes scorpioides TaxID=51811 RepID=A0ABY6LG34_9ARAC|nr:hypothetical protein LAZ67_18001844 [Cordylochernes scorpioides]
MPGHRKRRQFKQTDAFTRGMVIGLKRAGWSIRQIAADTHLGASTVHRLWRRWLEQGNVAIYRNVGATRVTSARVDRRILRQAVVTKVTIYGWINLTLPSDIYYWRRYVDDIFCIIKSDSLHLIHSTLHSFNSHIKFTYEAEQNCVLPFLDILIIRTPYKFHITVYYKTIPPQYTHFSSNSPIAYKINTVRTLSKRIFTHRSPTIFKTIEKARIVFIIIKAGYPRPFIYRHFYDPSVSKSTTIHRAACFLPYSTSSLAISRILRPFGIKVHYNSSPCLSTILRHPITKADNPNLPIHSAGAVYVVSCQDCSSTYVG